MRWRKRDYFDDPEHRKRFFLNQELKLNDEEATKLAAVAKPRTLQPKQQLYKKGQTADRIFFVFEGSCELQVDGTVRATIGKGKHLGEYPLRPRVLDLPSHCCHEGKKRYCRSIL